MERPGPEGSSARATLKVAPWSDETPTRTPPPVEPPEAASHAMYTLSRNLLEGLASAVIIGLSLKWSEPFSKEKNVTDGYDAPPSVERATAISVPLMPLPLLK